MTICSRWRRKNKFHCFTNRAPQGAACILREPTAEPAVQFHQHEIDHPAKETAFIYRFHHNQRPLLNGFIIQFKVDGADNLPFGQRRGQLRIIQGVAGLEVFQLAFRQRDGTRLARPSFASLLSPNQTRWVMKVASGLIGVTVS